MKDRLITIRPDELKDSERVYVINNTVEYYAFGFGVMVVAVSNKLDFETFGFDEEEREALWNLPIGEKFDSRDYGNSASVVRLA